MSKKREKPIYAFTRRGNFLVPALDYDTKALEGVKQGQTVRVEVKQFRNVDRLRAYWAMLHEVVSATDAAPTAEQLHEVVKLQLGFVDLIALPDGVTVGIPGSVAFEAMTESEFVSFFQRAEAWLARTYGYVKEKAA